MSPTKNEFSNKSIRNTQKCNEKLTKVHQGFKVAKKVFYMVNISNCQNDKITSLT